MLLRHLPRNAAIRATRTHLRGPLRLCLFASNSSQRTWPYRSGRPTIGARQNVKTAVETDTKSELVPPPRFENFESQMANTVTLSGFAMDTPEERSTRGGSTFARLTLAVPRESSQKETTYSYFETVFFDFAAKQVRQHVQKGIKMVIQGALSSYKGRINVVVRDFAFLNDESFQYEQPSASAEAAGQSSAERTIVDPFLKPSEERVYDDYIQGHDVEAIAKERNIKEATVLSYLADAAFHGKEMDFEWLAKSCLLGTGRSRYMKIDNVHAAIQEIIKKEGIEDLTQVPVRDTHQLVKVSEGGRPFRVQEGSINGVTYAQMRTVLAMMKQGLKSADWNSFNAYNYDSKNASRLEAPY